MLTTDSAADATIRHRILQAIFERRLPPGEKLTEERLAELFSVSRTIVRHALARLAQDGIVIQRRNHGATVAAPTRPETRQFLAVRRMVEPAIVMQLAGMLNAQDVSRLRDHLAAENAARTTGDRPTLVRLTGEFHLLLAELTQNNVLTRLLTELQALTCLAILLYAKGEHEACPPDEHSQIVAAIIAGEGKQGAALMLKHLDHVEAEMDLSEPVARSVDLAEALGIRPRKTGVAKG
ncbi:GntR family transcriptional regulator [Ferrovibrio terrae]|uniref:GntR family transcriptional regulator n=1 Tax=Ferrovibrio terrae TaxID=2594003 RepID=UPI00313776B5